MSSVFIAGSARLCEVVSSKHTSALWGHHVSTSSWKKEKTHPLSNRLSSSEVFSHLSLRLCQSVTDLKSGWSRNPWASPTWPLNPILPLLFSLHQVGSVPNSLPQDRGA